MRFLLDLSPRQGNLRVRFLTLTIPNTDTPEQGVIDLIASFRRLRQRKFWRQTTVGGLYVIELTNKGNGWHAHLHILVYGLFLPWKQLHRAWLEVSPGRGVFIKETFGPTTRISAYVTKYVTKTNLSDDDRREASRALKDARLFQVFGDWQSYGRPAKITPVCPKCGDNNWIFSKEHYWKTLNSYFDRRTHAP